MTGLALTLTLLVALAGQACADGSMAMQLKKVLLDTDVIILVEITQNEQTTEHRKAKKGTRFGGWTRYTNDIKSKVISTHLGEFSSAIYNTKYVLTLVKRVWLVIPGSGLEGRMKPTEKYVLLLKANGKSHKLLRAEKAEKLGEVLRLRKEVEAEDRRVAKAQAKLPNGIYHVAEMGEGQKIRVRDGRRVQIGKLRKLDIAHKKLQSRHKLVLLSLTLRSDKAGRGVLMVDGKGYWLFDHHWASGTGNASPAVRPPTLFCSVENGKEAEAVAAHFRIAITTE
jgi:hypothetical protein